MSAFGILLMPMVRAEPPTCVPDKDAAIPRVSAAQGSAAYWIERFAAPQRTAVLLDRRAIDTLNRHLIDSQARPADVLVPPKTTLEQRRHDAKERLDRYTDEVQTQVLSTPKGDALGDARRRIEAMTQADVLRAVHTEAEMRCLPSHAPIYRIPADVDFDRNRCTGLHPGEVVRVLGQSPDGWLFISAGHSTGWIMADPLSPPLTPAAAKRFMRPKKSLVFVRDALPWRLGTHFPLVSEDARGWVITIPSPVGLIPARVPHTHAAVVGTPALTRAAALDAAFSLLGAPYGWGDRDGQRDCSRLILDVLGVFGLELGRNSLMQSRGGTDVIDVEGLPDADKRARLIMAAERGLVLLYMPGHIMLYVGNSDGQLYALSAISEFVEPCPEGERVRRTDRVAVTDLELGRGTTRKAFIERITRLVVFGSDGRTNGAVPASGAAP